MDSEAYKKYHEDYMFNNTGSTILETGVVLTSIPIGVFLSVWVAHFIQKSLVPFFEFFILVVPIILGVTLMSNEVYILPMHLYLISFAIIAKNSTYKSFLQALRTRPEPIRGYITNYRASTNLVSILCILAVDFSIFPKKFAKTETFGYGLMDLGVGFYICSNGLVIKHVKTSRNFFKLMQNLSILVTLGVFRLILTKSVNYHEHVAEYGVHWNFFLTLALCKFIAYIVVVGTKCLNTLFLAIGIAMVHQALLHYGLQDWVLSNVERDNFFNANREGLSSCLGYVSLYFASISLGNLITNPESKKSKGEILVNLIIICILSWCLTAISHNTFGVSRRLANLGYILWVISLTLTKIIQLFIVDIAIDAVGNKNYHLSKVPVILEAINENGLFYFLLGNLLTGLINLMFQTLFLDPIQSVLLLMSYMVITCAASYFLFYFKIKLSFL